MSAINIKSSEGATEFGSGNEGGKGVHLDFTTSLHRSVYATFNATAEDVKNGVDVIIMAGLDLDAAASQDGYVTVSDKFGYTGDDVKEGYYKTDVNAVLRHRTEGMSPQKSTTMQRAGVPVSADFVAGVRTPTDAHFATSPGADLANQDGHEGVEEVIYDDGFRLLTGQFNHPMLEKTMIVG